MDRGADRLQCMAPSNRTEILNELRKSPSISVLLCYTNNCAHLTVVRRKALIYVRNLEKGVTHTKFQTVSLMFRKTGTDFLRIVPGTE
jgi:hypothetical protein